MDTGTEITFGGGVYRAWLPLPQAIELERKCGGQDRDGVLRPKSLFTIYEQIGEGFGRDAEGALIFLGGATAAVRDINETIRLGLIGGNSGPDGEVGPVRAGQLVELYGYPARPLQEVAGTAWKILHAAIHGIDLKKKDEPADQPAETKRSPKAK